MKQIVRNRVIERAENVFTDRVEPRRAFWEKYEYVKNHLNDNNVYVLSYYGIGGIGKTTLLSKLSDEIEEKAKVNKHKPYYLLYNFEKYEDTITTLSDMRRMLESDYKFEFKKFDLALYKYASVEGKDATKPAVKSVISQSRLLSRITDVIGHFPVVSTVTDIVKQVDEGVADVRNLFDISSKNFLKELDGMKQEDLVRMIPKYFSDDLYENIKDLNVPFVMLLDTYEKLVNEIDGRGYTLVKDMWLRDEYGPILNCPNILWVIAGREKLRWDEYDKDWEGSLESHLLGDLSKEDTKEYLRHYNIVDDKLVNKIYDISNGTPIFLDICIMHYEDLKKSNTVTLDAFGMNHQELIERYIKYMDVHTRELVYVLSEVGYFKDEYIYEDVPKILSNFSIEIYENIKKLSFVSYIDGYYYIHKAIAWILREIAPRVIKEKAYKVFKESYRRRILEQNPYNNDELLNKYREFEAIHMNGENDEQIISDVFDIVLKIAKKSSYYDLNDENIHFEESTMYSLRYGPNDERKIKSDILSSHAWYVNLDDEYIYCWAFEAFISAIRGYGYTSEIAIETGINLLASELFTLYEIDFYIEDLLEYNSKLIESSMKIYGKQNRNTIKLLVLEDMLLFYNGSSIDETILREEKILKLIEYSNSVHSIDEILDDFYFYIKDDYNLYKNIEEIKKLKSQISDSRGVDKLVLIDKYLYITKCTGKEYDACIKVENSILGSLTDEEKERYEKEKIEINIKESNLKYDFNLEEIIDFIFKLGGITKSLLGRRFKYGYARVFKIFEYLEKYGLIRSVKEDKLDKINDISTWINIVNEVKENKLDLISKKTVELVRPTMTDNLWNKNKNLIIDTLENTAEFMTFRESLRHSYESYVNNLRSPKPESKPILDEETIKRVFELLFEKNYITGIMLQTTLKIGHAKSTKIISVLKENDLIENFDKYKWQAKISKEYYIEHENDIITKLRKN